MKKIKINLNNNKFPYMKHLKKIQLWEKMANSAYKTIMASIILEINNVLKSEKLVKSDGWSENVNIIKLPLSGKISNIIDKHLEALKWVLVGKQAGSLAVKSAKMIGIYDKVTPGLLISTYMDSLDTDRLYFEGVFLKKPDQINTLLISRTVDYITDAAMRYMEQLIPQIRNSLLYAIENVQESLNYTKLSDSVSGKERITPYAAKYKLRQELQSAAKKSQNRWNFGVKSEIGKASAVGSHQAMIEVFGQESEDIKIIWVMLEQETTCNFCRHASKNPDGSFKTYKLKDFKPSGYNYSRKRKDWELTIPPVHPNCNCRLIYVPPGFTVTDQGELIKL